MFWKDEIQVNVIKYLMSNIDVEVNSEDGHGWWHLTRFYGNLEASQRSESWNLLNYLRDLYQFPWLVISDYNKITRLSEK